jgi:hypothetical protein
MTTRTIQCLGYGFGDTPATIVVKINGVTIFDGEIATAPVANLPVGNPYDSWANSVIPLYTFTTTVGTAESLPTTMEVTNGTLLLAYYNANYSGIPSETPGTSVSSGPDSYMPLSGEVREGVTIDEVAKDYHPLGSETELGTWWWQVESGSIIAFNALIDAGTDNVAPPAP